MSKEKVEYQEVLLERSNDLDLFFMGKELAHESEPSDDTRQSPSRWTEWTLYEVKLLEGYRHRPKAVKYVLYHEQFTCVQGENDTKTAHMFKSVEEIVDYYYNDSFIDTHIKKLIDAAGFGEYLIEKI